MNRRDALRYSTAGAVAVVSEDGSTHVGVGYISAVNHYDPMEIDEDAHKDGLKTMARKVVDALGEFELMGTREAPNDPVFWLHHCNIDRLWWLWQRTRGIDTDQPRTGTTSGVIDNTETMRPFATGRTPAAVRDISTLGYNYA